MSQLALNPYKGQLKEGSCRPLCRHSLIQQCSKDLICLIHMAMVRRAHLPVQDITPCDILRDNVEENQTDATFSIVGKIVFKL